ncbi:hypothetical protein [Actinomadura madurae]|uniref:hypothetical protein n=1 Tax=Actinomadura madurae TaxID=1993 RepID=UPI0020D24B8B|nr:hypothetical protein [Actinomadura madurae]MCP9947228.1 hypothetical protein [Actinomadura madurae]MCP9963993.1 hypothetical protein [Actinomadura madurae]MCP9976468.1 hypothetical protein [Actinomadura madurae]MCQ0012038.1 hypothetical protein [Actinomadura madurae]MCQ0012661.1 hypothetical protein [Actinomadura madurae]
MRDKTGVWVARYADGSSICPFGEEIDALRHAVDHTMEVAFIPWGEDARTYKAPPERPKQPAVRST